MSAESCTFADIYELMEGKGITLEQLNEQSRGTLIDTLGIRYTLATPERVEAVMVVNERTRQPFGILHGGAALALAETVAGLGSMLVLGEGGSAVGMQVSGSHVSSARDGEQVRAVATPVHIGFRTHVWNIEVEEVRSARRISTVRVTNMVK